MTPLGSVAETALFNAALAAAMALVLVAARRAGVRPRVLHVLWWLVLLKLVAPPLFELPTLPLPAGDAPGVVVDASRPAPAELASVPAGFASAAGSVAPPAPLSPARAAFVAWLGIASLLGGRLAWRLARFGRRLRRARPAPASLRARVAAVGRAAGLRRVPPVFVVDARVSPFLWSSLRGVRLYLPAGLLEELSDGELDAILRHELAHYARRDPWGRPVETLLGIVCWWNPLVPLLRRQLRRAEEEACDAWVLERRPDDRLPYAEALLATLRFLNRPDSRLPTFATGVGGVGPIKERLTMILEPAPRPRRIHGAVVALLLTSLLLVLPTWAERDGETSREGQADRDREARLQALRAEEIELERRLHELRLKQEEMRTDLHRREAAMELARMERDRDAARSRGESEHAALLEREMAILRHEAEAGERIRRMELDHERRRADLEADLRTLELDAERARAAGDDARADDLELERRQRELAIRKHELEEVGIREHEHRAEVERMRLREDAMRLQRELESKLAREHEAEAHVQRREALSQVAEELKMMVDRAAAEGDEEGLRTFERELESVLDRLRRLDSERRGGEDDSL